MLIFIKRGFGLLCLFSVSLLAEVEVHPFNQDYYLVTFSLNILENSSEIFWCCDQQNWRPVFMRSFQQQFFLQVLLRPGRYVFKYRQKTEQWFLDPDPHPTSSLFQITPIEDGFGGYNHLLILDEEKISKNLLPLDAKTPLIFPYEFEPTPYHLRLLEEPSRLLLILHPLLGEEVFLQLETKLYPLSLVAQTKDKNGFELRPIPEGNGFFQIGDWFLTPVGLKPKRDEFFFSFFETEEEWLQLASFREVKASKQEHHGKIVYQIFPDRFCKGSIVLRDDERPWGAVPRDSWDFFGGDLLGILQKLPYLASLGVELIYLNPIFLADTNHRYNTTDYFQIDPRLGSLEDFQKLVQSAKDYGIGIILDGVFNHTGESFFAFQNLLQFEEKSVYQDWYYVLKFPLKEGKTIHYEGWWGLGSLPKLRITTPAVREYIYRVSQYWAQFGIVGYRLDVPNEWRGDYWPEFRSQLLAKYPSLFLIGEIWESGEYWLYGNRFDGITHYPLQHWLLNLVQEKTQAVEQFKQDYQWFDFLYGSWSRPMNWNLLSSHDTERFLTQVGGAKEKLCLAALIQYGLPGMPVLYYGDEAGLQGAKDPDCRRCYPWSEEDNELLQFYQQLGQFRQKHLSLKKGTLEFLPSPENTLLFCRTFQNEMTYVMVNLSAVPQVIFFPEAISSSDFFFWGDSREIFLGKEAKESRSSLTLSAHQGGYVTLKK